MKKLMICAFMLLFAISAFAARTNTIVPILPVPCDTSAAPDAYGYTYVDNDGGGSPHYSWIDISTRGTQVVGLQDDNTVGPIQLGFTFPYYWYNVSHLWIGSNGYISFSSNANYSQDFAVIPSTSQPNDIVAPLAGDLDFTQTSSNPQCFYYTNNIDTFIVSWINVREWDVATSSHTFQLILAKNDSSITFQYGVQTGTFDNNSTPGTHSCEIGIEDEIGRTGLNYMSNWTPTARVPHDALIVRLHASPSPTFVFHDVGVKGGMNASSGAVFERVGRAFTPQVIVKNYGTVPETNIQINCTIKKGYSNFYNKNDTIDTLAAGAEIVVSLRDTIPSDANDVFSLIFRTTLPGDQFTANNRDTVEMNAYDFTQAFSYVSDSVSNFVSWNGGSGGWANEFVIPDRIKITDIQDAIMSDGTNPSHIYILPADANGDPDVNNILWSKDSVFTCTAWVQITVTPQVIIEPNQKFFVSLLAGGTGIGEGTELVSPYSNRGWEYTTSYATARDRETQDISLRVVANEAVGIEDNPTLPANFSLLQNYPNPFNANTEIAFNLQKKCNVTIDIYNIAGQKVKTLVNGDLNAGSHKLIWNGKTDDGNQTASGVYFYRLSADNSVQTKKMVMLK
jgi:hypothetical protein